MKKFRYVLTTTGKQSFWHIAYESSKVCCGLCDPHIHPVFFCADLPAGVATLTMHTDQFAVGLQPVTYYTHMGEISHFLENAADPVDFMRQVRHHAK